MPNREEIAALLVQVCGTKRAAHPGINLLEEGLMDSLAVVEFFDELNLLGLEIQPTQISLQHLQNIDSICSLLGITR